MDNAQGLMLDMPTLYSFSTLECSLILDHKKPRSQEGHKFILWPSSTNLLGGEGLCVGIPGLCVEISGLHIGIHGLHAGIPKPVFYLPLTVWIISYISVCFQIYMSPGPGFGA